MQKKVQKIKRSEIMARHSQVIAVVIKQYGTGLYRACVSLDRDDVTFLSAHKDERSANETINLFWRAYDDGQLKTPEDVATFIDYIRRKNMVLPDEHPVPPPTPSPISSPIPPPIPSIAAQEVFTPLAA